MALIRFLLSSEVDNFWDVQHDVYFPPNPAPIIKFLKMKT